MFYHSIDDKLCIYGSHRLKPLVDRVITNHGIKTFVTIYNTYDLL